MTIQISTDVDDDPYDVDADPSPAFRLEREVAPPRVHEAHDSGARRRSTGSSVPASRLPSSSALRGSE
jgi:hypothetical protein